jgi:hypothetical protein
MVQAGCDQSLVSCPGLDDDAIERARARLIALADQWAKLTVGESLAVEWTAGRRAAA